MTGKPPDTPVVHLPWSHWEALTARLDALEAAVFKLPPKQDQSAVADAVDRALRDASQSAAAPPPTARGCHFDEVLASAAPSPPAAPCADEVEALFPVADAARSKHLRVDPNDQMGALGVALEAALAELAHLRAAERERAWLAGAEATRSALAAVAEARGARALAYCLREFPLPPAPAPTAEVAG